MKERETERCSLKEGCKARDKGVGAWRPAVARSAHGLATQLLATGQPTTQARAWQTNSRLNDAI